jgi:methionyl-tRNA formyltransferase
MRIVFCGSGGFAGPSLRAIAEAGHTLAAVVTQPARPSGRGGKLTATPLAQAARELDPSVNIFEFANINEPVSVEAVRSAAPDVIVVADFGQFIRAAARATAPLGAFNLHGSLLPELRGAAPVNWAIINGQTKTGVTTFSLVDKMDAGAIYLKSAIDINPDETADQLRLRLADIGARLVCQTIDLLADGKTKGQEQDESKATLAPRLTRADGLIDWSATASDIRNRIHGVWPWPAGRAVFLRKDGSATPVLIARCKVTADGVGSPAQPEASTLDKDLTVICGPGGGGRIAIVEIQPAGKRLMGWRDFCNGYRASAGDKFIRPPV